MLTADLVRCRIKAGRLSLVQLKGKGQQTALELGARYLALASDNVGKTREQLKLAWAAIEVGPRERKVALGLQKLIEDQCEVQASSEIDTQALRSRVFLAAASARRGDPRGFDRNLVLEPIAGEFGIASSAIDDTLYADLPSQQVLTRAPGIDAQELLTRYEQAQIQAVLLRAVRVVATVRCLDVSRYRSLFRALKFHRLLYVLARDEQGYRITIDGPFSLFEATTKYGLQLALVFGSLLACDELTLTAELKWGKERRPASFEFTHTNSARSTSDEEPVDPELLRLREALVKQASGWTISANSDILELPGVGLCVPDLCCVRGGKKVYVEVLGFWSRQAVWKRVELVEQGLGARIVFAVSSRLRVSEEALDGVDAASLYVYKGTISARALLEHMNRVAG
jgi:hypothetical protein